MTSPLGEQRIFWLLNKLGLGEGPKLTISLSITQRISKINESDAGLLGLLVILKFSTA